MLPTPLSPPPSGPASGPASGPGPAYAPQVEAPEALRVAAAAQALGWTAQHVAHVFGAYHGPRNPTFVIDELAKLFDADARARLIEDWAAIHDHPDLDPLPSLLSFLAPELHDPNGAAQPILCQALVYVRGRGFFFEFLEEVQGAAPDLHVGAAWIASFDEPRQSPWDCALALSTSLIRMARARHAKSASPLPLEPVATPAAMPASRA